MQINNPLGNETMQILLAEEMPEVGQLNSDVLAQKIVQGDLETSRGEREDLYWAIFCGSKT